MEISIIINTDNQYHFLERCVISCIKQNFKQKFEIIIVDSTENDQNKNFYDQFKNIKLIKINNQHYQPCINQMECIRLAFEKCTGKIICLIDGDDFFDSQKLSFIFDKFQNKKFINQDVPYIFYENNNSRTLLKKSILKNFNIYKKFINSWSNVYGTSCLSADRITFNSFLKKNTNINFPFLAIDTLLVNYAFLENLYYETGTGLTMKSVNHQNLDKRYSNFFNDKFWQRRVQQHNYFRSFKKYYNLDYFFSQTINFIIQKLYNIK